MGESNPILTHTMESQMSKRIASSPEVQRVMANAIASNLWEFIGTNGHTKLRHKASNKIVVAAVSPSCPRAAKNLARDIRHVEAGLPGWGMPNVIASGVKLKNKRVATA